MRGETSRCKFAKGAKVPLNHPRQTNMMHDIKIQYILTKTAVRDTDNTEGSGLKSR